MIGNVVLHDHPSMSSEIVNGITLGNDTCNPASEWPQYTMYDPQMMNFNTTCPQTINRGGLEYCVGPNEINTFRLVDGFGWEGGRGLRCDFWKLMGELVPE